MKRIAVLLLTMAAVVSPAAPARAEPPSRLAAQVVDDAGALGGGRPAVDAALSRLRAETGLQLFVVFVPSFDGRPAQEWTDETARLSDLGDRDALLAVATTDRAYAYAFPDDARLSDSELTDVAADRIEPALGRGDWAGAVVAGADGYRAAITSSSSTVLVWVAIGFVIVLGLIFWVLARRRRARAAAAVTGAGAPEPAGPPLAELSARANALLLELDDDLRASERELTIATGQYGTAATERFRTTLESARADVAEAFRLRTTLDGAESQGHGHSEESQGHGHSEESQGHGHGGEGQDHADGEGGKDRADGRARDALTRIIELCQAADQRLDAESAAFDELRDLEGRAAEVADEVERRHAEVTAALPTAEAAVGDLTTRYAGPPVTAVAANPEQARERLTFAASSVTRARAALAEDPPDRAEAALAVRAAEQAIDQAQQLVAAVSQAGADLDAARTVSDALVLEVEAEIAAGRATLASAQAAPAPELSEAVRSAEQVLAEARAELAGPTPDPVGLAARLQAADAQLDHTLAAARDSAERAARARSLLAQALPVARAEVAAANSYITTRRGGVDTSARATLAEAERHLALAEGLAATDPTGAVGEAQAAQRLASSASRLARADVQMFSSGYETDRGVGDDLLGAFLGGLLAGGGGGSRSRGGWAGGGGWSGGGFGGSGSRTRRTGGSRRGGGGRF